MNDTCFELSSSWWSHLNPASVRIRHRRRLPSSVYTGTAGRSSRKCIASRKRHNPAQLSLVDRFPSLRFAHRSFLLWYKPDREGAGGI